MQKKPIRLATILAGATITLTAFALSSSNTPGENFPIMVSAYQLQTFNSDHQFQEKQIDAGYQDSYFYTNCYDSSHRFSEAPCGAAIFRAPTGYGHSDGSADPRVELRGNHQWYIGDSFTNIQKGTAYIVRAPAENGTIIAQIHGDDKGTELLKLRWNDNQLSAGIKTTEGSPESPFYLADVHIGDEIQYTLKAIDDGSDTMTVTLDWNINGSSEKWPTKSWTFHKSDKWAGHYLYFKAGDYNQDSSTTVNGDEAVVAYTSLDVTYN